MALAQTITIVEDIGGGETAVVEQTLPTTEFAVKIDGILYRPAITTNVEIENDGDVTRVQDQCGHTEANRTTNQGWSIRVQGIITGNEGREGNLSLALLRDTIANRDSVEIRSDVISGRYEVSNTVITQANDLVSINTNDTNGEEKAFEFQLQLGQSESDD